MKLVAQPKLNHFATKNTKFGILILGNLRVLRDLRGKIVFSLPPSLLARGAIKSAAIADGDALDDARTDAAFFAVAVVNSQVILKLARLVVGIAVIRKRRAAPADRVLEQARDRAGDSLNLPARQTARARRRLVLRPWLRRGGRTR